MLTDPWKYGKNTIEQSAMLDIPTAKHVKNFKRTPQRQ